ncbi:MAG: hypothetical protein Q8K65_11035 [Alphaproteobacteria bacterium]|nr:hypothetical protein [Alphaproteobacteria bacterium]
MTPQTTPDITPPPFLVEGATVRFDATQKPSKGHELDWRLPEAEKNDWEVTRVKTDQRRFDDAPQLYVQLRSIGRMAGLAFMTIPYDPATMQVTPPPPKPPKPQIIFPEPGSEVYIRESDDPSRPSFRDGLWEVRNAFHKAAEDGRGEQQELRLVLESLERKNKQFMQVTFNAATMKPVMPAHIENSDLSHIETKRDVDLFQPLSIRKRNVAP